MTEALRTVPVAPGETLSRIAAREGYTIKEILTVNPQIHNPNRLSVGQQITLPPPKSFELTVRFVNSWDVPPVGIRYELLNGKISLAKGRILLDNEATFSVNEGATVTFMAQQIGDPSPRMVGTFVAKREHPVLIARIDSFKLPSFTDRHPKTGSSAARKQSQPSKKDQGAPNRPTKNDKGAAEHQILPGECACGRDLTIDELAAIFPARKKGDLKPYLAPLNSMFKTYGIDSCLRKTHALAQIGHESGSLRYRAEVLPKGKKESDVYDGYKGRGLIQITYRKNYAKYGKFKGISFIDDDRTKLENHEYATDSAGWYWCHGTAHDLNGYADKNDLIYISASINGGFNGFDDRAAIFARVHRALNAPKCKVEANRSAAYLCFRDSAAFNARDMAFAWGYWSDPASKRKGLKKENEASKAGYKRFLDLNESDPIKKVRFGFDTTDDMINHAKEKIK
jgi:putative chitinase